MPKAKEPNAYQYYQAFCEILNDRKLLARIRRKRKSRKKQARPASK
jgi:hypothetical protein